jgi:phosphopantetheinyl transferase (holo-ACP synthase)
MILSIGIDIVEVYRIAETLARTPRFTERVFTETERAYCDAKGAAAASLRISGEAQALFEKLGALRSHISISHTAEHAVAQVIFEN